MLERVVGRDAHIAPSTQLTEYGEITNKYIENINMKYESIRVDKYVIMPNHIHMILFISNDHVYENGAMWASRPTTCDFFSTFGGVCIRPYGLLSSCISSVGTSTSSRIFDSTSKTLPLITREAAFRMILWANTYFTMAFTSSGVT